MFNLCTSAFEICFENLGRIKKFKNYSFKAWHIFNYPDNQFKPEIFYQIYFRKQLKRLWHYLVTSVWTRGGFGMEFFENPQSPIPIPGIGDGDFLFWARSKNPREFGIFISGIGDF